MASSYLKVTKATVSGLTDDLSQINSNVTDLDNATMKKASNLSDLVNAETARSNLGVYSTTQVDTSLATKLAKSSNLSDLTDASAARTNIDVYSTSEVDTAISDAVSTAVSGLPLNRHVANHTELQALTGLIVGSYITVEDDGDGKWARYEVTAVTNGNGSTSTIVKRNDQDIMDNALAAADIKAAYESNADTNAFTDAEQTKVGHISVTSAINLDKVIQSDELIIDLSSGTMTDTTIPSAKAVKDLVDSCTSTGALLPIIETLTVSGSNTITLTHAPKNGLSGIANFALVECAISATESEFARISAVSSNVATVGGLPSGSSVGKQVTVQYFYTAG